MLEESRFIEIIRSRCPLTSAQFVTGCDLARAEDHIDACTIRGTLERQLILPRGSLYPYDNLIEVFDWLDITELLLACADATEIEPSAIDYDNLDGTVRSIVQAVVQARGR